MELCSDVQTHRYWIFGISTVFVVKLGLQFDIHIQQTSHLRLLYAFTTDGTASHPNVCLIFFFMSPIVIGSFRKICYVNRKKLPTYISISSNSLVNHFCKSCPTFWVNMLTHHQVASTCLSKLTCNPDKLPSKKIIIYVCSLVGSGKPSRIFAKMSPQLR